MEIDTESSWAVASIGPGFMAAYLRERGHEVSMLRVGLSEHVTDVIAKIQQANPGLLGLSLTTRQWQRARRLVRDIRAQLDIPLVAGGLHPTFAPEQVLAEPGFDYVCLGEGEEALHELVVAIEQGSNGQHAGAIRNIWPRGGVRPELRPPMHPPEALPFLARDMLDEQHGVIHMTTQRGCPFPCTYCAAGMYNRMYGGNSNYGRRRSVEHVLAEVDTVKNAQDLNYIIFLDDTFTIHPSWVFEFCDAYSRAARIPFSLHARADTVDEEMIQALRAAGCTHIVYGVESGSMRIRQEIMQRPITNEQMAHVFRVTQESGIIVTANYMIGLPDETAADLEETFVLHEQLDPYDFGYFVFYPYPGTRLFEVCRDQGLLPEDYAERSANHRESILNLQHLSKEDIATAYDRFTELRKENMRQRLGTVTPSQQDEIDTATNKCAATG